ncbi:MAG: hypothetical protein ACYCXT_01020 [Acidiferrobacteraceae bacterium]
MADVPTQKTENAEDKTLNVAERLRTPENVCAPDPRQEAFVNVGSNGFSRRTMDDHFSEVTEIALHEGVPERVRVHFETSRNLLLYSWFVYRFIVVAEQHVFASVEYALKEKYSETQGGLKRLLQRAVDDGLIKDKGFRVCRRAVECDENYRHEMADISGYLQAEPEQRDIQKYCNILVETLPYLRNELAHGSDMVHPGGYLTLEICADLINQLYPTCCETNTV